MIAVCAAVSALLLALPCTAQQTCAAINQCTSGNISCNAAAYANTANPSLQYMICCMPTTQGPSKTYGDGSGCMLDQCASASSKIACMSLKYCVPIPYTSSQAPSLSCIHQEKLCWTLDQSRCTSSKYCIWSAGSGTCLWGLTAASTPVPVAAANTCPTINIFVLIMLIFMFVSLVAAIVTVAVVVVVNQRKAEREAMEEEEAAAAGGPREHEL